ncbi:MAG: penicillin-binding transpeptidase domain-containing protein, partial [Chloroflexota bacterium]
GYDIAAKTGTANIPAPGGGYINGATVASITGYAPASSPRFVALAIIDRPKDTPWGSVAAAPILHNLFQDLFMYYHIPPSAHALYR